MNIPKGVSHMAFWAVAKQRGIKITSQFTGVSLFIGSNKSPYWRSQININGNRETKLFELSEKGEIEAASFYKRNRKVF